MPKLNPTKAAEVRKAGEEGSKFVLLPIGKYRVKLEDVESTTTRPKPGEREGKPMWIWKFETVSYLDGTPLDADGNKVDVVGKSTWYRTVIQDNTLWDLDRVFAAFEVEPDTDTDELVGDEIIVVIDQSVITAGKLKGKMGNEITDFLTLANGAPSEDDYESVDSGEPAF